MFPSRETDETLLRYQQAGLTDDQNVPNPWCGHDSRLFISALPPPDKSLREIIHSAVIAKMEKRHDGKKDTVLILDNRTSLFDAADVLEAAEELDQYFDQCPFREIWFYTGYFSDHDGQNAEYSNIALKLPADRQAKFLEAMEKLDVDERGRTIMPSPR